MRVGLIGLGDFGDGMCARLLGLGHEVVAWDPSEDALARAAARGATRAESHDEVVTRCDVVLSSLPDPAVVREVYLPPGGVLADAAQGTTFVETSTADPGTIQDMAAAGDAVGAVVLDVAVSGDPSQAAAGELAFRVGGDDALIDAHLPLLEALAATIDRNGDPGAAAPAGAPTGTSGSS